MDGIFEGGERNEELRHDLKRQAAEKGNRFLHDRLKKEDPKAAGKIHSDIERGFIRAEVYKYDDLVKYGSEQELKAKGLMTLQGKEYEMQDGDVVHFRFSK